MRDLLVGLVELIHPHGTVNAAGSVQHYVQILRSPRSLHLDARGFTGGAGRFEQTGDGRVLDGRALGARRTYTGDCCRGLARPPAGLVDARLSGTGRRPRVSIPSAVIHQLPPYPESGLGEADTHLPGCDCRPTTYRPAPRRVGGGRARAVIRASKRGASARICAGCWRASVRSGIVAFGEHTSACLGECGAPVVVVFFDAPAGSCSPCLDMVDRLQAVVRHLLRHRPGRDR